jgi:hypothetical protein
MFYTFDIAKIQNPDRDNKIGENNLLFPGTLKYKGLYLGWIRKPIFYFREI